MERLFRKSGRDATGGSISRILEKRNPLQMSQVFRFRTSVIRWASLFKDSISEAASADRYCSRYRYTSPV
jgi:hypothetical protein